MMMANDGKLYVSLLVNDVFDVLAVFYRKKHSSSFWDCVVSLYMEQIPDLLTG